MNRRSFLTGIATTIIAAPAIVRAASLMPVRASLWAAPADLILPLYGRSPAMVSLDILRGIERWVRDGKQLIDAPHNVTDYIPIGPTRSPRHCDTHLLSH